MLSLLSVMHSNRSRVSRTRVTFERSNSSAGSTQNSLQLSCRTSERQIRRSGARLLVRELDFRLILLNKQITYFFIRHIVAEKRSFFVFAQLYKM